MKIIVSSRFSSSILMLIALWTTILQLRECSSNRQDNNRKDRKPMGSRIPLLQGLFKRSSSSPFNSSNSPRQKSTRKDGHGGFWNRNARKRQDSQAHRQQSQKEEDEEKEEEPDGEQEQQPEEVTQVPGNMLPHGIFRGVRDRLFRDSSNEKRKSGQEYDDDDSLIPLVYRYYGRNRARTHTAGSIPFLILGPNVDHWKMIGQQLAAQGFSVMACERVHEDDSTPTSLQCTLPSTAPHQLSRATRTLLTLLDALRWKRVVLVGCDSESALAVRAALELAPERIVGLVLCGSLEPVEPLIQEYNNNRAIRSGTTNGSSVSYFLGSTPPSPATFPHGIVALGSGQNPNTFHVDRFLKGKLKCPFTIVWGGDDGPVTDDDDDNDDALLLPQSLPAPSAEYSGINDAIAATRRTILGAGSAPHRRRPEMFAWVLTRFVEEEIATGPSPLTIVQQQRQPQVQQQQRTIVLATASRNSSSTDAASIMTIPVSQRQPGGLHLPFELQEFFSSQAMVVIGRVMATALFYATALRVGYYQYDNCWHAVRNVSAQLCKYISKPSKWGRKVWQVVRSGGILSYFRHRGVVPILSCLKRVAGGILLFHPFQKDDIRQLKEASDDSEGERLKVPETKPSPGKKDEEQADKKKDISDKDNDTGTRKPDGNNSEEVKPGVKPFFLLDRVIA